MASDIRDRSQPPWKLELRVSKRSYDEAGMYNMLRYDNAEIVNKEYSSSLEDEIDFSIRGREETYQTEPSLERWYNLGIEILSMTDCEGTEYTKRDCLIKIEGKW